MGKNLKLLACSSIAALTMTTTGALASTLQLTDISAAWSNVVGDAGANPNINNADPLNPWLAWGEPAGGGTNFDPVGFRSGFEVVVADPSPSVTVPGEFDFGAFTHFNNPIFAGTGITSVDLTLTTDVLLDGTTTIAEAAIFLFTFGLNETTNSCTPLPDCADDIVTVTLLNDTSSVEVDGVLYTLNFLGFVQGGVLNDQFISPEGGSSPGTIRAEFTSSIPGVVPLPGAGWLLMAGLGGLAAFSHKKRKAG